MGKTVSQSHITGEKGVAKFQSYCVNHKPFLLWREEAKNDFGIDGEVELTHVTSNGKTEATGSILKVQIKSTKTESYIGKNDKHSFEFIAKEHDINYWKSHHLPVILVVYFETTDELYAKKVEKDIAVVRNKKSYKINFEKSKHRLLNDGDPFSKVVGQEFVERIGESVQETMFTNMFEVNLPPFIYEFDSKYGQAKRIFDIINEEGIGFVKFTLISNKFYCFSDLDSITDRILNKILKSTTPTKISTGEFVKENKDNRRVVSYLINTYLKDFFYGKKINYNKEFKRYYFAKLNKEPLETKKSENKVLEVFQKVKYKGKSNRNDTRSVVSKYTYYESAHFYRHLGFQTYFRWAEERMYLVLEPKYLFSEDGKNPLDNPKRITRLTNQIKITERNQHYLNHVFFFQDYFSSLGKMWISKDIHPGVHLSKMQKFKVGFGIKSDSKKNYVDSDNLEEQLKLDF